MARRKAPAASSDADAIGLRFSARHPPGRTEGGKLRCPREGAGGHARIAPATCENSTLMRADSSLPLTGSGRASSSAPGGVRASPLRYLSLLEREVPPQRRKSDAGPPRRGRYGAKGDDSVGLKERDESSRRQEFARRARCASAPTESAFGFCAARRSVFARAPAAAMRVSAPGLHAIGSRRSMRRSGRDGASPRSNGSSRRLRSSGPTAPGARRSRLCAEMHAGKAGPHACFGIPAKAGIQG